MTETKFLHHVKANEQKLFRFALSILKDVTRAEDAVQDLVAKLWKRKDSLSGLGNLDVYFMVAMKNHCFDEIKKQTRRRTHYQNAGAVIEKSTASLERSIEKKDLYKHVRLVINELPETQQMVIQLRDIEQLEMNEIEEITGLNAGAIRTNLSRARKTIREKIRKINQYGLEQD